MGAVALLTGCPPPYPKCNTDENCKEHNEVCVQGQCVECATDDNCKAGFVCQDSKCLPKPECAADADCGTGKGCREGRCVTVSAPKAECASNAECGAGRECLDGRCVAAAPSECRLEPIRFGFNEYSLSTSARSALDAVADCIKKKGSKVTIEGHADERGTEEYNLQLSNRRAATVKRYLTDLGVAAGTLETVGYGEERPSVNGSNEEAWAANRRVEFSAR